VRIRLFALFLLALGLVLPQAAAADTIIVKRAPGLDAAERADVRADADVKLVETLALPRAELVSVPAARADAALRALNADPDVVYAERSRTVRAFGPDEFLADQWGFENVGQSIFGVPGTPDADLDVSAVAAANTGAGVQVAVVDSGLATGHPDLAGQALAGFDFVEGDTVPQDANGHGTHVTGTIAALRGNDIGVAGIAPGAKIRPYRVLAADGTGSEDDVVDGLYVAGQNARVVNASLGALGPLQSEYDAIAANPQTLYVVAAGNGDADEIGDDNDNPDLALRTYPCAYDLANVLCVGASDNRDLPTEFSNFGRTTVDLFAPGYDILSTDRFGDYEWMSGTSMAAPHVAGIAALLLASEPGMTVAEMKARILAGADTLDSLADLSVTGGRANAQGALAASVPDPPPDPPVVTPPPPDPPVQLPPPPPPADGDGDGRDDASDGCPRERAATRDGCPLARVRSLSAKAKKRVATVRVRTSRAANARITVERRKCKRQRCRWTRVTRKTVPTRANRAKLTVRGLRKGRHRAVVVLSSSAGKSAAVSRTFRVK
jgi:thermitase